MTIGHATKKLKRKNVSDWVSFEISIHIRIQSFKHPPNAYSH